MSKEWFKFQEVICDYFKSIGAEAKTNVSVQGVRTSHDIDILVKTKFLGEDLLWIIEAKKWKEKVNKLHVLALRTIVEDIGDERGCIVSEAVVKKGAVEAAKSTNIKLKTFDELKLNTKELIEDEILKTYKKRVELLEIRYWSHSKRIRQEYGLRNEIYEMPPNFSGQILLSTIEASILAAEKKEYPINLETYLIEKTGELIANNFQQLINWLNINLNHLDEKIIQAEIEMIKNHDFNPVLHYRRDNTWKDFKDFQVDYLYKKAKKV